jgi:hypothetical protein
MARTKQTANKSTGGDPLRQKPAPRVHSDKTREELAAAALLSSMTEEGQPTLPLPPPKSQGKKRKTSATNVPTTTGTSGEAADPRSSSATETATPPAPLASKARGKKKKTTPTGAAMTTGASGAAADPRNNMTEGATPPVPPTKTRGKKRKTTPTTAAVIDTSGDSPHIARTTRSGSAPALLNPIPKKKPTLPTNTDAAASTIVPPSVEGPDAPPHQPLMLVPRKPRRPKNKKEKRRIYHPLSRKNRCHRSRLEQ